MNEDNTPGDLDNYEPELLKESPGDYVHALGIDLLSLALSYLLPGGQIIAGLVGVNRLSPMLKRVDKWMVKVNNELKRLQDEGITLEEIVDNPTFVTALLQASQMALRTHQETKLNALCNAVINAALSNSFDTDLQFMFLSLVDSFTESHLLVLARFKNEPKGELRSPLRKTLIPSEKAFPQLEGRQEFILQITKDLRDKGLLQWEAVLSNSKIIHEAGYLTDLGDQFLAFITLPFPPDPGN